MVCSKGWRLSSREWDARRLDQLAVAASSILLSYPVATVTPLRSPCFLIVIEEKGQKGPEIWTGAIDP